MLSRQPLDMAHLVLAPADADDGVPRDLVRRRRREVRRTGIVGGEVCEGGLWNAPEGLVQMAEIAGIGVASCPEQFPALGHLRKELTVAPSHLSRGYP